MVQLDAEASVVQLARLVLLVCAVLSVLKVCVVPPGRRAVLASEVPLARVELPACVERRVPAAPRELVVQLALMLTSNISTMPSLRCPAGCQSFDRMFPAFGRQSASWYPPFPSHDLPVQSTCARRQQPPPLNQRLSPS